MSRQVPMQIMQMPQQKNGLLDNPIINSLFQLATTFADSQVPGLGTAIKGTAGALKGGGAGGLGQGIQQLSHSSSDPNAPGGTPPIQDPSNAQPPAPGADVPKKEDHTPKQPAQPLGQPQPGQGMMPAGGGAGGQQGGGSGGSDTPAGQIPDPLEAQRKQEQAAALQAFTQQHPELFSLMSQNPHYLEGLVRALTQMHGSITQPQQPQMGGIAR